MEADQNQTSKLECSASGIPKPNITWVRQDGKPLPTGYAQFRVSHFICISLCVLSLSVCMSVCLCLCVCLSVSLSLRLSVSTSVSVSLLFIRLSFKTTSLPKNVCCWSSSFQEGFGRQLGQSDQKHSLPTSGPLVSMHERSQLQHDVLCRLRGR